MKISYITQHGYAELINIEEGERNLITLKFIGIASGAVTLGALVYTLKGGEVTIKKSDLPSGEYHPRLECDTGIYIAEGFSKSGDCVAPLKTEESVIRRLLKRCNVLESSLDAIDKRVNALEIAYKGHNIFNFERKEK